MIDSIQGPNAMGPYTPVSPLAGSNRGKKAVPMQATDYKVSFNKEVVQTLTYERTGSVGDQPQSQAPSLEALLSRLFGRQGVTDAVARSGKAVEIDPQTRAEAQELISEDGYWGVDKTSDRIFEFAVAGAGEDPTKLKAIKAAIEKGFAMAATSLGGSIPDISSKTYDAVMEKLDEWGSRQA